jgi:site-specific recombinase XerD
MEKPRLLDQVRSVIRVRHYSRRTEEVYIHWIRRFILSHHKRHPLEMGKAEVEAYLSWLAEKCNVAASTQNQALSAILFPYRDVLQVEIGWPEGVTRAKKPKRLPVVLTREEVRTILASMRGTPALVTGLLYGAGLRLLDGLRLRVQDIDFAAGELLVRDGKGREGSAHHAAAGAGSAVAAPSGAGETAARQRSAAGIRQCLAATCAGAQVPERRTRLALAIRLSRCNARSR